VGPGESTNWNCRGRKKKNGKSWLSAKSPGRKHASGGGGGRVKSSGGCKSDSTDWGQTKRKDADKWEWGGVNKSKGDFAVENKHATALEGQGRGYSGYE